MMNLSIKQLALISVLSALALALGYVLPLLLAFFVILIGNSLKKNEALFFGLIIGILSYLITGHILTLLNIVFFPGILWVIKTVEVYIFGGWLSKGCLSRTKPKHYFRLGLVSFILLFISNVIAEIIAGFMADIWLEYMIVSLPIALASALVTGILIGLLGIPIQKRLNKALYILK